MDQLVLKTAINTRYNAMRAAELDAAILSIRTPEAKEREDLEWVGLSADLCAAVRKHTPTPEPPPARPWWAFWRRP